MWYDENNVGIRQLGIFQYYLLCWVQYKSICYFIHELLNLSRYESIRMAWELTLFTSVLPQSENASLNNPTHITALFKMFIGL